MEKQAKGELIEAHQPRRAKWRRFVVLEPAMFFYAIGDFMNYTIMQQYVYYRVARDLGLPVEYMMEESGGCGEMASNGTNVFVDIEKKVQSQAAMVNLGLSIFIQVPSVIVSLLFGAWTDKNGRRPALFSPVIGSMAHCIIQLLVMYFNLPIYVLFLASFVDGCSGYIATMQQTSMAYVVDITSESNRIFRVAVLQCLVLMAGVLGYMVSGFGIEFFGFIAPVWFILGCQVSCFLYLLILPESRPKVPDAPRFLSLHSFKSMWSVYSKPRSDGGRKVLSLLITSNGLMWLTILGIDGIITLFYLASPLCFSSVMIGYMYSYWTFVIGAGAVVFTLRPLLRRVGEFKMAIVGSLSTSLALGWLAFCDRRWMIYVDPVLSLPAGAVDPILKGWMSKIVSFDEQGAMFAVVTTVETVAIAIGMFMFNPIYAALVEIGFGALTFLIPAAIAIIPLIIICCLRKEISVVEQKQAKRVEVKYSNASTEKDGDSLKISIGENDKKDHDKQADDTEMANNNEEKLPLAPNAD